MNNSDIERCEYFIAKTPAPGVSTKIKYYRFSATTVSNTKSIITLNMYSIPTDLTDTHSETILTSLMNSTNGVKTLFKTYLDTINSLLSDKLTYTINNVENYNTGQGSITPGVDDLTDTQYPDEDFLITNNTRHIISYTISYKVAQSVNGTNMIDTIYINTYDIFGNIISEDYQITDPFEWDLATAKNKIISGRSYVNSTNYSNNNLELIPILPGNGYYLKQDIIR